MIETAMLYSFLQSKQAMAAVMRTYNWASTSLGEPGNWPEALKSALGLCLSYNEPCVIMWGKDLIQLYNDAYRQVIGIKHEQAFGKKNKETWEEIWDFIEPVLNKVMFEGEAVNLFDQHYPINRYGYVEDAYFTTSFMPIYSEGKVEGIFVISRETTDSVILQNRKKEGGQLAAEVFMQAPMGICTLEGPEMKITLANEGILRLWRRDATVIGKSLADVLPELKDQGFFDLLKTVYETGKPFHAYERLAQIMHGEELHDHYFDFVYAPLLENGHAKAVMAVAVEVTAQVEARRELQESEKRFKSLIEEAPMATALYVGREMRIEVANQTMLSLWGKDASVIGMRLQDALPELEGQPFLQLLDNVYTSGKAYHTDMQSADLVVDGQLQRFWFNFTYKPLHDANGNVYAVLNMAVDISKQVHLQQQKDEFLGIASHELKTPVTTVKAYAQVLQQMMDTTKQAQEYNMLARMDKQVNKLTGLIENLLDVTKIQAGKLEFNETKFDFNAMVSEVVHDMRTILTTHAIELQTGPDAMVFADRMRIEQVVTNLITNAVKYSPNADYVSVTTQVANGTITCAVKDKGVGIPAENLENIFDRFYQVNSKKQNRFSGLGLGLYISSEIVRRSNGEIRVSSTEGEGSVFEFSLNIVP